MQLSIKKYKNPLKPFWEKDKWVKFVHKLKLLFDYKCEICLEPEDPTRPEGYLHGHHIQKQRLFPELKYDKHNVIIVCQVCHSLIENLRKEDVYKLIRSYRSILLRDL